MSGLPSQTVLAGAAVVDITPSVGQPMSGFAARTASCSGMHDPLTARALVVGDTAIVVVDVIGLDPHTSARIRSRAPVPDGSVVVAALHTHGGPVSMAGALGRGDPAVLAAIEDGCVEALVQAHARRQPCRLSFGIGADPDVACNRRRPDGPRDGAVPVLRVSTSEGLPVAVMVSHACHPVVLGADNTLWTADYPAATRLALEAACPGAVALFLTGCAGDLNTGHTASASFTVDPAPRRTFAEAERIGEAIARNALAAPMAGLAGDVSARATSLDLPLARQSARSPEDLAAEWRQRLDHAAAGEVALLQAWIRWAKVIAPLPLDPVRVRVAVLDWLGLKIVALPGEPFCSTGLFIRGQLGPFSMTIGYAESCPGYIPPREEYVHGGYEVEDAHRYYGQPAPFAPGCAERLAEAALDLARSGADGSPRTGEAAF